jgi:hypothetical protein
LLPFLQLDKAAADAAEFKAGFDKYAADAAEYKAGYDKVSADAAELKAGYDKAVADNWEQKAQVCAVNVCTLPSHAVSLYLRVSAFSVMLQDCSVMFHAGNIHAGSTKVGCLDCIPGGF